MLGVEDRKPVPLLVTPASEQGGWISPAKSRSTTVFRCMKSLSSHQI